MTNAAKNSKKLNILLIGCGKMGSAMALGWNKAGLIERLRIVDPTEIPENIKTISAVTHVKNIGDMSASACAPDCVIMAVKPQMMKDICNSIKPFITAESVIISIAAGTPISLFESAFGTAQPVIRAMPNTPAAIRKGMTAAMPNSNVSPAQKAKAENLLGVSGALQWVDNEDMFHAITALSGSGPAYIFLLIETMTQAGIAMGLDDNTASLLARQTVIGSAALAEYDAGTEAAQLRKNVTSPGGTTEAALKVLMDGRLEDLFTEALKSAQNRSKELSKH